MESVAHLDKTNGLQNPMGCCLIFLELGCVTGEHSGALDLASHICRYPCGPSFSHGDGSAKKRVSSQGMEGWKGLLGLGLVTVSLMAIATNFFF